MSSLIDIQNFLAPKKLAIAGASRNPKKFGAIVFTELKKRGFELYPVHPSANEIQGIPCYSKVDDLPAGVDHLYIVTPKSETLSLVSQALSKDIKQIWIQQSSDTPDALELAKQHQIPVISGRCMLMFAEPVGSIHGFHRFLSKVFRTYPS